MENKKGETKWVRSWRLAQEAFPYLCRELEVNETSDFENLAEPPNRVISLMDGLRRRFTMPSPKPLTGPTSANRSD